MFDRSELMLIMYALRVKAFQNEGAELRKRARKLQLKLTNMIGKDK